MTSSHPTPAPCQWFSWLAAALDRRSASRLALLFFGAVIARGRRTVTTWIRAAQLSDRFQSCYIAVAAAGKKADSIAWRLLTEVVRPLLKGATRLTLALDDTPTKRYGPHVQGAGIHHNPTPGPAGSPYVYGHVFVVMALLVAHPAWQGQRELWLVLAICRACATDGSWVYHPPCYSTTGVARRSDHGGQATG
jgi:DDE superfamily endonuclease